MKKKLLLDGLANYLFFVPIVAITTGIVSGWTINQYVYYVLITAPPVGFIGGIIFGRFINRWRKWLKYD